MREGEGRRGDGRNGDVWEKSNGRRERGDKTRNGMGEK